MNDPPVHWWDLKTVILVAAESRAVSSLCVLRGKIFQLPAYSYENSQQVEIFVCCEFSQ